MSDAPLTTIEFLTRKAVEDPGFRKKLIASPHQAIEEVLGQPIPEGTTIEVLEETWNKVYLVLPPEFEPHRELSEEELKELAGTGDAGIQRCFRSNGLQALGASSYEFMYASYGIPGKDR